MILLGWIPNWFFQSDVFRNQCVCGSSLWNSAKFPDKKLLFALTHEMELLPKVFWKMHSHHSSLRKTNSEFTLKIDQGPREGNDDVISQPSGQILATSHDLTPNGGEKQGQFLYFRETQVGEIFSGTHLLPENLGVADVSEGRLVKYYNLARTIDFQGLWLLALNEACWHMRWKTIPKYIIPSLKPTDIALEKTNGWSAVVTSPFWDGNFSGANYVTFGVCIWGILRLNHLSGSPHSSRISAAHRISHGALQ